MRAVIAWNARLHGDTIAGFEGGDGRADFQDNAGGFVAEDHGLVDDVGADAAVLPVMDLEDERETC